MRGRERREKRMRTRRDSTRQRKNQGKRTHVLLTPTQVEQVNTFCESNFCVFVPLSKSNE